MNIGEKIKTLRTAKLMTQSELAGSEITRNMLSRIENGAAQPSLDTLIYISKRLNVSAGYLLADGKEEQMYKKQNEIVGIKTAYMSGDYRICRDMCLNSSTVGDDEIQMILAECTHEIAKEEFANGNLRMACEYFDLSLAACAETIYNTSHVHAIAAMYFKYMRKISATLSSDYFDETDASVYAAMSDEFCKYISAFISAKDEGIFEFESISEQPSLRELHIKALKYISEARYLEAYECLHSILVSEEVIQKPVMYFIFCDLEICCKEINDFKGAYEYSINKIELLQKMLS